MYRVCIFDALNVHNPILASSLFNVFGVVMTELQLNVSSFQGSAGCVIASIVDSCTSLKSMSLKSYVVPDQPHSFAQLNQQFSRLEELHIESVCIADNVTIPGPQRRLLLSRYGMFINFFAQCNSLANFFLPEIANSQHR